jgi:hypothetical protein
MIKKNPSKIHLPNTKIILTTLHNIKFQSQNHQTIVGTYNPHESSDHTMPKNNKKTKLYSSALKKSTPTQSTPLRPEQKEQ